MKKYYIYYAKGYGCHSSKDDVAIIKARNEKEAKKILEKDVNLDIVKDYTLTRVKIPLTKYHDKHIYFISEY